MMNHQTATLHPVYKIVRGKLKELGNENATTKIKETVHDGLLKDLESKTVEELEEILERQNKILKNQIFISRLKDKGEKLKIRTKEVSKALQNAREKRKEMTEVINGKHYEDVNALEWPDGTNGNHSKNESIFQSHLHEGIEDDFKLDPLQLLATHSHDVPNVKFILRNEDDEDPASVIQKELEALEINDSQLISTTEECTSVVGSTAADAAIHVSNLTLSNNNFSNKLIKIVEEKGKIRQNTFKPFRPLKAPKQKECKEKNSLLWMESSATGPKNSNMQPTQLIPLQESLLLMKEAQENEKIKMIKNAADNLSKKKTVKIGLPTSDYLNYRDKNARHHLLDDEEEEEYVANDNNDDDDDDDENALGGLTLSSRPEEEEWDEV